jgi:hypothetical protein
VMGAAIGERRLLGDQLRLPKRRKIEQPCGVK